MFTEHLKKVVDQVEGGVGAVVMGLDGIAVESYVRSDQSVDVTTIGMEFSFILGQAKKAAESLEVGSTEELTVRAERLLLVIRMLPEDYFLALIMAPDGNFGKARFLMRLVMPALAEQL